MTAQELWAALKPDAQGLVVAVVQHAKTDRVLMVGYMNADALAATLERKRVTFWSRSRNKLWEKGETSGNTLALVELRYDCDADALLVRADPAGPTCHLGKPSCFHERAYPQRTTDEGPAEDILHRLTAVIEQRRSATEQRSYVRKLLDGGAPKIGAKLREEADELAAAIADESDDRVANEAADVLFHTLVALAARHLTLAQVRTVLQARFGRSGIEEKQSR